MLHPPVAFKLGPFFRIHLEEHGSGPLTIALGYEPRKRWRARGHLLEHGLPGTELNALDASVWIIQLPASWSIRACNATCSTPPHTPSPYCLASRLTSSIRGLHSLIFPAAIRRLHVIPTQTGQHFSPRAVRFDCRKSSQNSGGKASGSSTILLQKASMPAPKWSWPNWVLMMDCRCEKRRP